MPDTSTVAHIRLRATGDEAVIVRDPLVPGAFELAIGGVPQSHVDLGDPADLLHDYVRRIGFVIDRFRMPGAPVTAVHLGAGALTLARYVQATRPGSEQHVAELADDLVPFVLSALPLPAGTGLTVHPGDAARTVTTLAPGRADIVVSDLYRGISTPPHVRSTAFYRSALGLLRDDGLLVVNVADDDGLPALRSQLAALGPVAGELLVLGPARVLTDERSGNAVIVASRSSSLAGLGKELMTVGPHPGAALHSSDPGFERLIASP